MTVAAGYRRTRLKVYVEVNNTDATGSSSVSTYNFTRRSGEVVEDFVKRVRRSMSRSLSAAIREIGVGCYS